ncbi:uncharacterized protein LOC143132409 [Alosa pseudoharengus]|uniref:uncharacterized protein LOC143132409 n=1 Tax=Alosa pseudoharengus TaxID=34774 RepID=UPI003F8C86B5
MGHQLVRMFTPVKQTEHNTGGKMVKADNHQRFLGGMRQRFQTMLAAVGLISIMTAGLTVLTLRLVIIVMAQAIVRAIVRQGIVQTMASTVVTGSVNLVKHLGPEKEKRLASLVVSECGAIGAALGGAVGGAAGGAVHTVLGEVLPVFGQAIGVALGVVLGRTFGEAFTNEILKRNAITDKGIAGALGGALAGGFGALFGFMIGGIVGGFMGALLGAVGVKYLGNWLKKTFLGGQQCSMSVLSAIAIGLITSIGHITTIFGVIGLLGSLVAILPVLTVSNKQHTSKATHNSTNKKEVEDDQHTSTNKKDVKEEHDDHEENQKWMKVDVQKLIRQYFESILSAVGLITIIFAGEMPAFTLGSLAVIAAVLELLSGVHRSKGSSEVVRTAKGVVEAVVSGYGKLDELLKRVIGQKIAPLVSKHGRDACTMGGAIGGAVGGTIGGVAHTFLGVIHPIVGQAGGGALGAIVGWTIGKAFTGDTLHCKNCLSKKT